MIKRSQVHQELKRKNRISGFINKKMSRLSSNANVYNSCLRIIKEKGYELNLEGELDQDGIIIPESMIWIAEKI